MVRGYMLIKRKIFSLLGHPKQTGLQQKLQQCKVVDHIWVSGRVPLGRVCYKPGYFVKNKLSGRYEQHPYQVIYIFFLTQQGLVKLSKWQTYLCNFRNSIITQLGCGPWDFVQTNFLKVLQRLWCLAQTPKCDIVLLSYVKRKKSIGL